MLYHMVTGQLPFHGIPVAGIMDQQVTGQIADPLDLNPDLSMGTCWTIEKMLAKDRNRRQADWDEVLSDISRVLKGKLPSGIELPEGASTVKRSPQRSRVRGKRVVRSGGDIRETRPLRTSTFAWIPVVSTAVVITVVGGLLLRFEPCWKIKDLTIKPPPIVVAPPEEDPLVARGAEAYRLASDWSSSHPDDYDGAMQRFEAVASDYGQTRFSKMARSKIEKIAAVKIGDIKDTLTAVEAKVRDLVNAKRFEEAEALCSAYDGKFLSETADDRKKLAEGVRRKAMEDRAAEEIAAKSKIKKADEILDAAADSLIVTGTAATIKMMEAAMAEQGLGNSTQLVETVELLHRLESLDERVLDSFKQQEGRTLTVAMRGGNKTLKILGLAEGKIRCEETITKESYTVTRPFDLDLGQLSAAELVGRLGQGDQEDVQFRKGMLALQAKAFAMANDYFSKTTSVLAPLLARRIAALDANETNAVAESALSRLMKSFGVSVPERYDEKVWRAAIAATKFATEPQMVETRVEVYRKENGNSAFGRNADKLLATLLAKAKDDYVRAAAAALDRIDEPAIRKMLMTNNKDLESKDIVIEKSQRYHGYCLKVRSEGLVTIGPLRMCADTVTELDISNSKVKDLTMISGMNLRSLDISNTKMLSVPALGNVPLERLVMKNVQVRDLGFLSRTKLKELDLSGTKISDLRSIQHLPLESLAVNDTSVKDANVLMLKGLPLKHLSMRNAGISSITALDRIPLVSLDLSGNAGISDFAVLAGMPLRDLNLDGTGLTDLSVIKDQGLRLLSVANTGVSGLGPLKGMELNTLNLSGTRVRDLKPLAGMPLAMLDVSRTGVGDMSPLKGMGLVDLRISETGVNDLSPLANMALRRLYCARIWPRSWDPIVGMPITDLVISLGRGEPLPSFVHTLKHLALLNGRPVAK